MYKYELAGGYYDLGLQYGESLCKQAFSKPTEETIRFLEQCQPYLKKHIPELLTEIQGIKSAVDVGFNSVLSVPVALPNDSQCSAVAINPQYTDCDSPLFGRNYDFYSNIKEYVQMFQTRPREGYDSIGFSDHWVGRHDGINEAGLGVAITWVANYGYKPGITFSLATRHILDTYDCVEDAVEFLEEIPHARNTNFLLADSNSHIAIVEAGPSNTTTIYPEHGVGIITNHFTSSSMDQYERTSNRPNDTKTRYHRLEQLAKKESEVREKTLQQTLADPEDGVCAHEENNGIITLWSYTGKIGDNRIQVCESPHNKESYQPYSL